MRSADKSRPARAAVSGSVHPAFAERDLGEQRLDSDAFQNLESPDNGEVRHQKLGHGPAQWLEIRIAFHPEGKDPTVLGVGGSEDNSDSLAKASRTDSRSSSAAMISIRSRTTSSSDPPPSLRISW